MNIKERLRAALDAFAVAVLDTTRSNGDKEKLELAEVRRQNAQDAFLEFPMLGFESLDAPPDENCEVLILIQHNETRRFTIRTAEYSAFDDMFTATDDTLHPAEFCIIGWMAMPDQGYLQDMAESV